MAARVSGTQVLECLLAGNRRFVSGQMTHAGQDGVRRAQVQFEQEPAATVLACSDSRVAPEILFDAGLGEIFTARTAGQTLDSAVLGSLEYGVAGLGTPLLLVLGHSSCGAVTAACKARDTGELPGGFQASFVERIIPATLSPRLPDSAGVNDVVHEHVHLTVDRILELSPIIAEAVKQGQLAIAGGFYSLESGEVGIITGRNLR